MLFDAHNHAFRVLGGVPRRGIYDKMRTAVNRIGRGKERKVNARFSAMVSPFLFVSPANLILKSGNDSFRFRKESPKKASTKSLHLTNSRL